MSNYQSNYTTTVNSFEELGLSQDILRGVASYGLETPSPVQSKIKELLNTYSESETDIEKQPQTLVKKGRDGIIQDYSGSGKTVAFSLTALHNIQQSYVNDEGVEKPLIGPQVIIISHTHDLATQTFSVVNELSKYMTDKVEVLLCIGGGSTSSRDSGRDSGRDSSRASGSNTGGNSVKDNVTRILNARLPQIICGSPGRIKHLLEYKHRGRNLIYKNDLQLIILDEADELLKKNFKETIYDIFKLTNNNIQIEMFSATMPTEALEIADAFMRDPLVVLLDKDRQTLDGIDQYYIDMKNSTFMDKADVLCDLFEGGDISVAQCIIFCNKIEQASALEQVLSSRDFTVSLIHGKMSQAERDHIISELRTGSTKIVIASDLVARGINVQGLAYVFNFDFPFDRENYIHRIGRCGRFGRKGVAINLINTSEYRMVEEIQNYYQIKIKEFTI